MKKRNGHGHGQGETHHCHVESCEVMAQKVIQMATSCGCNIQTFFSTAAMWRRSQPAVAAAQQLDRYRRNEVGIREVAIPREVEHLVNHLAAQKLPAAVFQKIRQSPR